MKSSTVNHIYCLHGFMQIGMGRLSSRAVENDCVKPGAMSAPLRARNLAFYETLLLYQFMNI